VKGFGIVLPFRCRTATKRTTQTAQDVKATRLLLYQATLLALAVVAPVCAQSQAAVAAESVAQKPAIATNPTFLFRTLSLSPEWDRLADGHHAMKTSLGYTEPFLHASMSLGVSVPFSSPKFADDTSLLLPHATNLLGSEFAESLIFSGWRLVIR